jgi:hypothetical protein
LTRKRNRQLAGTAKERPRSASDLPQPTCGQALCVSRRSYLSPGIEAVWECYQLLLIGDACSRLVELEPVRHFTNLDANSQREQSSYKPREV